MRIISVLLSAVAPALAIACSLQQLPSPNIVAADGGTLNGSSGTVTQTLPCDVDAIVVTNCQSCHGAVTRFGAPMSLVTREDFLRPALERGKIVADEVARRIHDDAHPMPQAPNARLTPSETATMDAWLAAGTLAGTSTCGTTPTSGNGVQPLSCAPDQIIRPASAFAMSSLEEVYVCYGFDTPNLDAKRHVTEGAPHIDNPNIVHHVLLYQADRTVSSTPTLCGAGGGLNWRLVTGWAPGGKNFSLPPEAGFAEEAGVTHWAVQVHYNNAMALTGQVDSTGYDLCTTDKLRPNDADILATGTVQINIPPRSTYTADCDLAFPASYGAIKVVSSWAHMHKLGRDQEASRVRDGAATTLLSAPTYDFFTGAGANAVNVDLTAGDHVHTSCKWTNSTSNAVKFGEKTEDEMCFAFLTYYPKIQDPGFFWARPTLPDVSACKTSTVPIP